MIAKAWDAGHDLLVQYVCDDSPPEMVKELFNHKYNSDWKKVPPRAVSCAIEHGNSQVVEMFLRSGFDISKYTDWDQNPLYSLISSVNSSVVGQKKYSGKYGDTLRALFALNKSKIDVNREIIKEETPIEMAVKNNLPELASIFVEQGADLHVKDGHGRNLLMQLSYKGQHYIAERKYIIDMLIRHGLDPDDQDYFGKSAFDCAEKWDNPTLRLALGPPYKRDYKYTVREYFDEHYLKDYETFRMENKADLFDETMELILHKDMIGNYVSAVDFLLCQYELNLINQALEKDTSSRTGRYMNDKWSKLHPPFTDCRGINRKTSNVSPKSILRYIESQEKGPEILAVKIPKERIDKYNIYFIRDYLSEFKPENMFLYKEYLEYINVLIGRVEGHEDFDIPNPIRYTKSNNC